MKMKRFISALTGAAIALTMACTTAQATDIERVLLREKDETFIDCEAPDRPGERWQYRTRTDFIGFLVKMPETLPDTLAGLPIVSAADAGMSGEVCCAVCPGNAIADSLALPESVSIRANLPPAYRTPDYALLSVRCAGMLHLQALLDLLESPESPAELVGAVYVSPVQYGLQLNGAGLLEVSAETDAPDFWAGIAAAYGLSAAPKPTGTPDGVYTAVWLEIPFAEGAALADRLAADSRILAARAWLYYPDSDCPDAAQIAMYPVYDFGTGDMDENGTANIGDAVLLARYLAEDKEITQPTQNGKNLADMDGDGTLDSADLAALLELLANPS